MIAVERVVPAPLRPASAAVVVVSAIQTLSSSTLSGLSRGGPESAAPQPITNPASKTSVRALAILAIRAIESSSLGSFFSLSNSRACIARFRSPDGNDDRAWRGTARVGLAADARAHWQPKTVCRREPVARPLLCNGALKL